MKYVEVQIPALVDPGELLGMLSDGELLGSWEGSGIIHVFWPEDKYTPEIRSELESTLARLGVSIEDMDIAESIVMDQDWNARWAASVRPIRIGRGISIRQSWNSAAVPEGGFELIIDPKRAFGTGYHATTQLLAEWLEDSVKEGETVLDVGTGSGILAMIALRAGARHAVGLDNDPVAIECARENAELNGFGAELELRVESLESLGADRFDIIVANLDRKTLLSHSSVLGRNLHPEGRLLISGIQSEDDADITEALAACGGLVVARRQRDEWLAMHISYNIDLGSH